MCSKEQLAGIALLLADETRKILGDKLECIILYGSYARGDYDAESDIDIMVRIACDRDELSDYRKIFNKLAGRLSVENDISIFITLVDSSSFEKYKNHLPFYENVEREGVRIA